LADSEIDGLNATMAQSPKSRRRMTIPAAAPIQRHLLERRCSVRGTATVGPAALGSGSSTVVADLDAGVRSIGSVAGGIAMVLATGGANAIVFSMAGRG
jgi:hypothetical protein